MVRLAERQGRRTGMGIDGMRMIAFVELGDEMDVMVELEEVPQLQVYIRERNNRFRTKTHLNPSDLRV